MYTVYRYMYVAGDSLVHMFDHLAPVAKKGGVGARLVALVFVYVHAYRHISKKI